MVFAEHTTAPPEGRTDATMQLDHLFRVEAGRGDARIVQFISARNGEGTSSIARNFAMTAASYHGLVVVMIDLGWDSNAQYRFFDADRDVTLRRLDLGGTSPTFLPLKNLAFYQVGQHSLFISRYEAHEPPDRRIYFPATGAGFWSQLRNAADLIVIDAPAQERNLDGVMVSPVADSVVLVVEAERTAAPEVMRPREKIERHGGHIEGVVLNRSRRRLPGFLKRWVGR
jgi:Mrp family chromosome partitioning ATPase